LFFCCVYVYFRQTKNIHIDFMILIIIIYIIINFDADSYNLYQLEHYNR